MYIIMSRLLRMHTVILMFESAFFGLFVSCILMDQLRAILNDETTVEALQHRGSHRPNMPKYQLLIEVFGPGHPMLWLLPCAKLKHSERSKGPPLFSHEEAV